MLRSRHTKSLEQLNKSQGLEADQTTTCTCGLSFKNQISKDQYQLDLDDFIKTVFGNGYTLYQMILVEQGIQDLQVQDWTFHERYTRSLSFSITESLFEFVTVKRNFKESHSLSLSENYARFDATVLFSSEKKAQFECNFCIEMTRLDSWTEVTSWSHVHFLNDSRKKYVKRCNDWFVGLNKSFQQQLSLLIEKRKVNEMERGLVRGPRDFGERRDIALHRLADHKLAFEKDNGQKLLPEPPSRKQTKRIKVISSRSNSSVDSLGSIEPLSEPLSFPMNEKVPSEKSSIESNDSGKETLCDTVTDEIRTIKAKNPPQDSKWKDVQIPKIVFTKEPKRPISKFEKIVFAAKDTRESVVGMKQTRDSVASFVESDNGTLYSRESITSRRVSVKEPPKQTHTPKPVEIKVPNLAPKRDSFPPVHLPGMLPVYKLECDCVFTSHEAVGVTGYVILYYILHISIVFTVVTGSTPISLLNIF